jgi:hypothetical protein
MRKMVAWLVAVAAIAGTAWAQEPSPERDEERREPRRKIRVLQNPYDLASFYRSSQQDPYFGTMPAAPEPSGPYAIAAYYRQGARGHYSGFWSHGYGYGYMAPRTRVVVGYRRSIGENGDLFLFAPTFLAPIGPLSSTFFQQ